jgi:hypothetical protein
MKPLGRTSTGPPAGAGGSTGLTAPLRPGRLEAPQRAGVHVRLGVEGDALLASVFAGHSLSLASRGDCHLAGVATVSFLSLYSRLRPDADVVSPRLRAGGGLTWTPS